MAPRIIPGKFVLVGMTSSRTYRLLNVETFQELISADVKFDEYNTYNISIVETNTKQGRPQLERPAKNAESSKRPKNRPVKSTERPQLKRPAEVGDTSKTQKRVGDTLGASDQRVPIQTQTTAESPPFLTSRSGRAL
ncbi:hypothetical protein IFR05_017567, partial [Cadophora sp. M221]